MLRFPFVLLRNWTFKRPGSSCLFMERELPAKHLCRNPKRASEIPILNPSLSRVNRLCRLSLAGLLMIPAVSQFVTFADEPAGQKQASTKESDEPKPLNKTGTVLLDAKNKKLLLKSEVVLREGLLEMFVCLKQTKEHESILAVNTQAQIVHAGLLALGAQTGSPVRWQPEFQPATGQQINIFCTWTDADGKLHRDPAQTWIRNATRRYYVAKVESLPDTFKLPAETELKWDPRQKELLWYGPMSEEQRDAALRISKDAAFQKAIKDFHKKSQIHQMDGHWVFAGSYFLTDEKTGEKFYQAESGDLICVANFATATLDVSVNSSATNDDLMFEAYTEHIPPIGTKVTLELVPVFKPQESAPKTK